MKLHRFALAACAVVSGNAFALDPATTAAIPAANQLYIAGSSALQSVIEGLLTQNCVAGTYTKYKGLAGSAAGSGDTTDGNSHNAYSCTLITGSDFPSFDGQNVVIVKRESGGSAYGVYPLVTGAATIAMIDLSTCSTTSASAGTCSGVANRAPQAGVSDLEPVAFNYSVNQPTAFAGQTVSAGSFRSSTSVAEQIFALIVNDNLFNDLGVAQNTTTPTVSSAAFATIFAAGYNPASLGWTPFGKNLSNPTNQVNLCSRGIGSGTRATAQIQFLQLPYNPAAPQVVSTGDNTQGSVRGGNIAGTKFTSEESSSGNVVSCVAAANASGGYSIGIVGADRDLSNTGTHFVNLDNQVPGRATAKEGAYPWVFESFYQINKNNVGSNATTILANAFGAAFRKSSNINAVSTAAANGVMATPGNCVGTSATWTGADLAACSRVDRSKDSRLPLTFSK